MQTIAGLRKALPSIKAGTAMAVGVAVLPFLKSWIRFGFDAHVNIFELGSAGMDISFPENVSLVLNFIAVALVLNLVFWIAFKYLLSRVEGRERLKMLLEILALCVAITAALGVAFHWGLDRANNLYEKVYGQDVTSVYAYIYFMDEWLGHALQETSLMGYFVLLVIAEQLVPRQRRIHWVEYLFIIGIATIVAVTDGYAALSSESAILMLIASSIFLGVELVYKFSKKVSIAENPLLLATIIANIAVIVQNIVFIGMFGLSPWYPWLRLS